MPDETDIIISELTNAPKIDDTAVFPLTQDNGGSPATFKASMSAIAGKTAEGTTFVNLETTAKNLVGAINEVAQGGGGSADIISEASGAIATFNDGGNNIPVKSLVTEITAQQAGTPSPSNPLSISGFSAIDCTDCGINLWDEQWEPGGYNNATGEKTNANRVRNKYKIMVKPNTSIYIKLWSGATNDISLFLYDANGKYLRTTLWKNDDVYTIPSDCYFICFHTAMSYQTYNYDISFNYPSTDTSYHAYTGTTHTIALPETIYGGTAELVNGNGTKTFDICDLGDLSWSYDSTNKRFVALLTGAKLNGSSRAYTNPNSKCTNYEVIFTDREYTYNEMISGISSKNNVIWLYTASGQTYVNVKDTAYTDAPTFKTAMTGVKFVYELETSTAFTFTGANIPTLSGLNNIYSNTGDVEVEYFNENADQIAELIRVMTSSPETIAFALICPRTQTSNLQYEVYNHTITRNCKMSIQTSGLTDCGSNDAYLALLVNGVEIQRGTLITDTTTSIDFSPVDVTQGDTVRLIFGWANNHGASFSGSGKMVLF